MRELRRAKRGTTYNTCNPILPIPLLTPNRETGRRRPEKLERGIPDKKNPKNNTKNDFNPPERIVKNAAGGI